ncbi:MAG TPA: Hsp20/alpha crystallin family protein [Candidatus Omnitrophota bacterium]|nr:Hsp20/alpha crystallin family protein [Candidatus Omnitrophota bacterium]
MKSSLFMKTFPILFVLVLISTGSQAEDQTKDAWSQAGTAYRTASSWAAPQSGTTSQDTLPELDKLRRRMGEFLNQGIDDFQKKGYIESQQAPKTDFLEKDGAYYLLVDLPGVKKNEINIEVKGQELLISGERKVEEEFKVSNLVKIERRYGNFERLYSVPEEFIADQISAKYENGVLQIKIPRKQTVEAVKPKTIAIS